MDHTTFEMGPLPTAVLKGSADKLGVTERRDRWRMPDVKPSDWKASESRAKLQSNWRNMDFEAAYLHVQIGFDVTYAMNDSGLEVTDESQSLTIWTLLCMARVLKASIKANNYIKPSLYT
jgi:hypothetical protein